MSFQATHWARRQQVGHQPSKHVLLLLADHADENHSCFPEQALLAEDTEMSVRSVQECIKRLEAQGFLQRKRDRRADGKLGITRYVLGVEARFAPPPEAEQEGEPEENDSTPGEAEAVGGQPPERPSGGDHRNELPVDHRNVTAPATGRTFRSEPSGEPSKIEREAREREEVRQAEAALGRLLAAWGQAAAVEDLERVRRLFYPLSAADQQAAIDGVAGFREAAKALGRTKLKGLESYLRDRSWALLDAKPPPGKPGAPKGAAGGPVPVGYLKRPWWALFWARLGRGEVEAARRMVEIGPVTKAAMAQPGELPDEAAEAALTMLMPGDREREAWRSHAFSVMRRDLPLPDGAPIWVPARLPPVAAAVAVRG